MPILAFKQNRHECAIFMLQPHYKINKNA